ncbi:hypothetical protein [Schaalia sp. JY-X169]|uniref:hypothetical protein n=1 Tax=Schaalia sp. JY-X169 TaxID=2758572 RepID=UPI0015F6659C|nr:hypothetical protein [Schaalia sp. JY-X169]
MAVETDEVVVPGRHAEEVERVMALVEKGQQLAGHFPTEDDLAAARVILVGEVSYEDSVAALELKCGMALD